MDDLFFALAFIALFGGFVYGIITMLKRKFKRGFSIIGIGLLSFIVFAIIGAESMTKTPEQIEQEKAQVVADAKTKAVKEAKAEAQAKAAADAESKAKAHQANIDTLAKRLEEQGLDKKQAEYDAEFSIDQQNSGSWTAKKAESWLKQEVENKKYVDWRNSHFSAWDGSVPALVKVVKENMNNPKSFKHVETTYSDLSSHGGFKVRMVFRGTNAFNAVVTNAVDATFKYGEDTFTYQFEQ